eukprot:scaffold114021_cov20-Prasinocladus_malaysianus.AAC.1
MPDNLCVTHCQPDASTPPFHALIKRCPHYWYSQSSWLPFSKMKPQYIMLYLRNTPPAAH